MTAEQRKEAASKAALARWGKKPAIDEKKNREEFASKFVTLLEQHMQDRGLNDEQKDAEFAEMFGYVQDRLKAKKVAR